MRRKQVLRWSGSVLGAILTLSPALPDDCDGNGLDDIEEIETSQATDCDGNFVLDDCDPTPDCNRNGIPDSCDVRTTSGDCNLNGVPDSCEPFLDCNSNGERDSCDVSSESSMDCNHNWVPDECEQPASDPCRRANPVLGCAEDCNRNLIHDTCDLAAGSSLDDDSSGIPDECERPAFTVRLGFRGPFKIRDGEGGSVQFEAVATLTPTAHLPLPTTMGVQGWAISVVPQGCRVVSATTEGTVGAPGGGYWVRGLSRTEIDETYHYVRSFVLLTGQGDPRAFLPLSGEPYDVLRVTLEADRPDDGTCPPCALEYRNPRDHHYDMNVAVNNSSVDFETEEATLCPGFRRGDVNGSARVDISDPIRLFMSLFLGAETPACLDGADADDDGIVNITDGIFLLQDLFRGDLGTVIPSPGPFECSPDPTGDDLDCADPGECL